MSIRWSFNSSEWEPSQRELVQISGIIQPEEKARIARFLFKRDAKSSLIGRLLIRKLVNIKTGTGNEEIQLGRDENNKPVLIKPIKNIYTAEAAHKNLISSTVLESENLNFNVSHQGDLVVLASEPSATQVGIDVMNIEKPGRIASNVDEYFRLMNRQFTDNEWLEIRSGKSDLMKMTNFTRFWCLKESYVKAVGVGIVIDLRTVEFHTKSEITRDSVVMDTSLKVHGVSLPTWHFEERFMDDLHIVCVAKELKEIQDSQERIPKFEEVSLDFLLQEMSPLGEEDKEWAEGFIAKK